MELHSVKNVEIFAAGTWNGDTYTTKDLDKMIEAFNKHSKIMRPYLKLGHDDEQKIVQKSGMPSIGWVENLKRVGTKLVADFVDIPKKIFDLIQAKAYRKVSSEIYWNININGSPEKHMLAGVALLGSELPAVSSLNDILSLYSEEVAHLVAYEKNDVSIKSYCVQEAEEMDEKLKEANEKINQFENQVKEYSHKLEQTETKFNTMKAQLEQLQKDNEEKAKKIYVAEREKFLSDLTVKNCLLPSLKGAISELYDGLNKSEKKEYSLGDEKLSPEGIIEKILKTYSQMSGLNFEDNTIVGNPQDEQAKEKQMQKLINEGKSAREAYKLVQAQA